jgi:voltage-gated potassium channel Kch
MNQSANNVSFRQRMRYAFDNVMSKGTPAMIAGLAIVSLVLVLIITLITLIIRDPGSSFENDGPISVFWKAMLRTLDPGTMGGDEGGWPFLLTMLVVTLGGIFIVSTLIGVLSSGIESKISELRKGRSLVLEQGHTLILGWSDQVFTIIRELKVANESLPKSCVVVLADKDKVEMEDEIRTKVGNTGKMRVVCRTGSPLDLDDLDIANPQNARSIIVLSPTDDDPDSQVIKTVLALTNSSRRRKGEYHIVAVIRDAKNLEAARLVGGKDAQFIEAGDTIARLIAQACRQSGLSVVYTELLDFGGDEIYMKEEPALVGKTFGDVLAAYEKCAVIGLHTAEGVRVNPPMETPIRPGDKVIVIAEDDSTIKLGGTNGGGVSEGTIQSAPPLAAEPERILIMGWNDHAAAIINELDNYVSPGSKVVVVATTEDGAEQIERLCSECKHLEIEYRQGDTTDRRTLDALNPHEFQHIVVLCYSDTLDPQRADARTLITLLHLRDIERRMGERFSIVSEMLDDRNRELAEVTEADDFIVSDKLISLMLAQISENKHLKDVFADLFDPEGSEIYVKPAADYVAAGKPVSFYTVVEAARRRGQCAIGYISTNGNGTHKTSVVVNPAKSSQVSFSEADRVVVLAEE